jgi:hypothetical protein
MRVIARRKVEDCFDGSAAFSFEVSEPWTAENVRCLAPLGEFEYFPGFPRPFFRLRTSDGLFVNGVVGAATCRVILPRTNRDAVQQRLLEVFL